MGKRPGDKVGAHSDVYGLGKTCCFALFGTTQPVAQHWRRVSLHHERDAGRVARMVAGVAIYTAAALMLLS